MKQGLQYQVNDALYLFCDGDYVTPDELVKLQDCFSACSSGDMREAPFQDAIVKAFCGMCDQDCLEQFLKNGSLQYEFRDCISVEFCSRSHRRDKM